MITAVIFLLFLIICIKYVLYRRQILDICRQLQFLKEHETNKSIWISLHARELISLQQQLNTLFEEQSAYRMDLLKKDRRLREMIADVSHDIRTPLTSLKGYFQLMLASEDPESRRRSAQVIQEKQEELSELLEELFTYTKLQNESYVLEMERINYTDLLLQSLFSFYEEFKSRGISPQMDMDESPCFVFCSPPAVKRITANIIRNALLHGDGQIAVTYKAGEQECCFSCANTLQLPDAVDMSQIFERFYKADPARSRHSAGLGLSIARGLAEKMGGRMEAELDNGWFTVRIYMKCIGESDGK